MTSKIAPYWALLRQQLIAGLQFRAGLWAKLTTNIFWGYVRAVIIWAFYKYGSGSASISLQQAVGIIWLQQIALNLVSGFGMDFTVWEKIRSGNVGYELLRPLDVYAHWYANAVAVKLAPFLTAIVPVAAVALLVPGELGLMPPVSFMHLIACLFTLMTGLVLSCGTICLSYAMLMDVRVGEAPSNMMMTLIQIMAGAYLPLSLWPQWMQGFLYWQPFAGVLDLPLRFYVGAAPVSDVLRVVLIQAGWATLIIWAGRRWIGRNLKKLTMQGG